MNATTQDTFYKQTYNKMGYMTTQLDEIAESFLQFAAQSQGKALEIGAAFGQVSLEAANRRVPIIANDIDQRHLDEMLLNASIEQKKYITPLLAEFPNKFNFEPETFSAVLICRVLHFFPPALWVQSIEKIFELLKPGGKVFLTNESPYFGTMRRFIPIYEKRKASNYPWPGLVFGMKYFDESRKNAVDAVINLLDLDETIAVLEDVGFQIEEAKYLDRKDFYPDDALYDGREAVFAIAQKPSCEEKA